jgi:POT family proton-dependent oligopeptide transporter
MSLTEKDEKNNGILVQETEESYDLTPDGEILIAPTEEDWKNLKEVADTIPYSAYLVILIEFCERFTYYGLTGPFQNYIQNPDPGSCKLYFFFFLTRGFFFFLYKHLKPYLFF